MSEAPTEWLTVAEAAERLGVTAPRLRRLLARPENAERTGTRTGTHLTRTGTRTAVLVPFPFLFSFSELLQNESKSGLKSKRKQEQEQVHGEQEQEQGQAGSLPAVVYQKLLADKDAEIAYLRGQLDLSQRNQSQLHDALGREQSLRLLAAPHSARPGESEAAGGPDANGGGEKAENSAGEAGSARERPKRGFWARLCGKGPD